MNTKAIGIWTTTAIITFDLLVGGMTDLVRGREVLVVGQPVVAVLAHLGYPVYLLNILGVWKLLGAMALLAPGWPLSSNGSVMSWRTAKGMKLRGTLAWWPRQQGIFVWCSEPAMEAVWECVQ
jgi:hypothetical protein